MATTKRKFSKRKTKKKGSWFNRAFERYLNWLERMKPRNRVRVAWGCTLMFVVLVCCGYQGCKMAYHWAQEVIAGEWQWPWSDDEAEETGRGKSGHYEFPIPDHKKHPKRKPNYGKDFNYLNDVQLRAARKLGIKPPQSREDIEKQKGKLVKLTDTRYYQILPLTSSSPYLVPRAADFLTALGRLMQEYNGTDSRFLLSSVLRSQEDVKKLGKVNGNASENSTHCYGTTVDITYSRFDVRGKTTEGQLKEDLARALYDMQQMGYCYVKYERKQPCFHITVRK